MVTLRKVLFGPAATVGWLRGVAMHALHALPCTRYHARDNTLHRGWSQRYDALHQHTAPGLARGGRDLWSVHRIRHCREAAAPTEAAHAEGQQHRRPPSLQECSATSSAPGEGCQKGEGARRDCRTTKAGCLQILAEKYYQCMLKDVHNPTKRKERRKPALINQVHDKTRDTL